MKIIKYLSYLAVSALIIFLGFMVLTYNKGFSFKEIYIQINIKYLYALIGSSFLIATSTFIAQETLSNRMIDASFMGMGPIASFVIVILLSVFAGKYFERLTDNPIINWVLPLVVGTCIAFVGFLIVSLVQYKKLKKRELIILLVVVNTLLLTISIILMNKQNLSSQEYISTFIMSSMDQITQTRFIIGMSVWALSTLTYVLFLRKKTRIIGSTPEHYVKSVGINIYKVRSMNMILIGLMLGYATVISGNLAFLGITSLFIASIFTRKGSTSNLIVSITVALFINLLTYVIFESIIGDLSTYPFGAIISIIGSGVFVISIVTKLLRRKNAN